MKAFIKENRYLVTNQLLNQFGGAVLGLVLSFLFVMRGNTAVLLSAIFSVGFYVVLQYTALWDAGARDIIRVEGRRLKYRPYAGVVMALFANIPNFLIAICVTVGTVFGRSIENGGAFGYEWAGNLATVSKLIGSVWESMFNGFVQLYSPHNPIVYWFMPIVSIAAAGLGYFAGMKNFRIIPARKNAKKK